MSVNKLAKAQLIDLVAERNAQIEAARLRISLLEGELALRPALPAPQRPAPRTYEPRTYTPRALPAHFVAARELAMRTGACVKVSA